MTIKKTILFGVTALLLVTGVAVWQTRVALATRVVRHALDKQGLTDVTFVVKCLTPGHVAVEDVRVGTPDPVFSIDRVDVRFSPCEVLRRQVEHVRVQGVRTRLTVDNGKVASPAYERFRPLLDSREKKAPEGAAASAMFSLGAGSLQDARVSVASADGVPLTTLTFDAGVLGERPDQYRVWGVLRDADNVTLRAEGTVNPITGTISLSPEVKVRSVEKLLECACRIVPGQMAQRQASPTNCSFAARGTVALQGWTNVGPFELSAEIGRGSVFTFPDKGAWVKLQSFRVEASGTPRDLQCRVSAGVSGFKAVGQKPVSQEEGRMLSLRSTARFRQTATNQWVTASLDSDLPGRSLSTVLPQMFPLARVFFSDGGTLHAEAEVARRPQALWSGAAAFKAEAVRSSVPLTAGRLGAGVMRVSGTVAVIDGKPGVVRTESRLADGYFIRRDLSVRGGADMALTVEPPYTSASGVFKGRVSESTALLQKKLSVEGGAVPFEGEVVVTGLDSNPVWQVALRVPDFGVASTQQVAEVKAAVGAQATVHYSEPNLSVEGDAWVRDLAVQVGPASNRVGEAGVERVWAQVKVPSFSPATVSNAHVDVTLSMSNGWVRAGTLAVLEDARGTLPLSWSLADGLAFLPEQHLTWQRLEAQGLRVEPELFAASANGRSVDVRFGARVAGSKMGAALKASIPLEDLRQMVIDVTLPHTEIAPDDAVARRIHDQTKGMAFSGRVSAEAQVLFWGTHPRVVGRARLADGEVRKDALVIEGLSADVPFQKGISFRTIERPVVSFMRAKAGNVRLDQGRLNFQLTEKELFIDRMEVGWCKGSLNAYSVHLNLKSPKDDFVVYADRIDLGEALMMVLPFRGMMQGVLYGRFPVGFDNGHVKLSTGFLYSLPGQGGKLKLDDSEQMASLLGKAGIKGDVQVPLSRALSDMDFSTFKMDLEPGQGEEGTLRIKLGGKSNDKEWPAPVDLNLNLHGPLEELLNMGLNVRK